MSKSSLKKKVLCSLLAASVFGVMYNPGAEAAVINGTTVDSTITDDVIFEAGSGKFIIGQGDLNIQTNSSIHTIMSKYNAYLQAHPGDTTGALRWALAPTSSANGDPNDVPLVGVVGGEGQLDSGLTGLYKNAFEGNFPLINGFSIQGVVGNDLIIGVLDKVKPGVGDMANQVNDLITKIDSINTAGADNKTIDDDINIVVGSADGASPVVIGAVGGDLSVNTGLTGNIVVSGIHSKYKYEGIPGWNGKWVYDKDENVSSQVNVEAEDTSITRNGNVKITVNNGNLIGGVGGSAAVAMGNIEIDYSNALGNSVSVPTGLFGDPSNVHDITMSADLTMQGKTTTTINGSVNVGIYGGSNVAGFAGGGLAMGMGGEAASTVNGDVNINIDSAVELMDGASGNSKFDGITAGITGGGAAVTTFGGKADTKVGNVNIKINDGLSAGIIGGGVATAVDATGGAEVIMGGQLGNNDGHVDINIDQLNKLLGQKIPGDTLDIVIKDAVQGGEATSVTSDTNITLIGTSSAAGIVGGGVAISSHTYTVRPENEGGELPEGYNVNDSFGYSNATAKSGKTTITINVDSSKMNGEQKSKVINALKALKDTQDLAAVNAALKEIQDTGAVVGIVGGGVAVAQGSNRSNLPGNWGTNEQGAYSTATNTGAQINLVNGYAVGTFGGGMAVADNNALATAKTDGDIIVNIGNGTEAVGVFGNGLAYYTGKAKTNGTNGEEINANLAGSANVVAQNSTINVGVDFTDYTGTDRTTTVDGIIGGGVAIDDSQADKVNATVKTSGTATINVFDGAEVNVMTLGALDGLAGGPQTNPDENLDMGNYLAAVKDAAGNVAIAGGGVAIGGGADAYVENAVININGGTVNGDILGGGIAVYGHEGTDGTSIGGSHVKNATINLAGGKVDGSVYAGGAASKHDYRSDEYESAQATVETATINLQGTEVTDIISGAGYYIVSDKENNKAAGEKVFDYSVDSTLNLIGENTLTAVAGASKISGFNTINFTENSETILKPVEDQSGEIAGETVFIDGTMGGVDNKTIINVADSARLNLSNLADDKLNDYVIAKSYDDVSELWGDDQLAYDRTEGFIVVDETKDGNDNIYKVTYKNIEDLTKDELEDAVDSAAYSLGEYGDNVRNIIRGIIEDTDHDDTNEGAHDLITETFENGNQAEVEKCLYTSSMVGEDSGVTSNAISMAQDFADNALLRLSFTQDTVNTDKVGEEGGVWAKYLHNKHEVNGMNSSFGALNSSSDYDGVMVGAELAKKGNMQAGIAFAYGEGDGSGLTTKNDFDMWGISLYGNVKNDDINIIGDLGFSKSSNDITSSVLNNEFNTDRDLNIFTMGVRAEKLYTNGNTQVVPYIGLRYMSVDADSYATTYKSGDAFSYDANRQNIWTLPLGVSLRNETVTDNGWRITPKVDLAYIWAFGDTDNDMTIDSGSGADVLHYDVMDSGSWLASVGIDAGKGDWSYGLSYTLQKGSDAENNKWFVNVNYSF